MPLTRMTPPVGLSRSATARSNVVLPQPEGPMNETNSPRPIFRSTPLSACTGPSLVSKRSDTSAMSIAQSAIATALSLASGSSMSAGDRFCCGEALVARKRLSVGGERLALDEAPASRFPRHLAFGGDDLAARQREARQALDLDAFEDVVVDHRQLLFRRDGLLGLRVPDDEIGVGPRQDRALAG